VSSQKLLLTRAEILAVSNASVTQTLDRAAADAAIGATLRRHGGIRGCIAALAQDFGEHPETAAPRMRWARRVVADLYPAADTAAARPGVGRLRPAATARPALRLVVKPLPADSRNALTLPAPALVHCA